MKKLIISTFNNSNNNYGALFQSFAFAAFLQNMGYDVYNVTIKDRSTNNDTLKIKFKKKLKRLLLLPYKKKTDQRIRKMLAFSTQNQQQIVYENVQQLFANPPEADAYISGSDQVWNPVNIRDDFFLAYVDNGKKKISYAASMGHEQIPEHNIRRFAEYISGYNSVSVREDSMIPIISKYTPHRVYQHLDPVFLLPISEWKKLETPYEGLKYNSFIFVYALEWTREFNEELLRLKKRLRLPVVSINTGNIKRICADQVIYNASPNEFLYILSKASFVASSSFHGTAMSIVYNKPFISFLGKDKPTRIASLLRCLHIDDRSTLETALLDIDYSSVNSTIEEKRAEALDYLSNSINN